MIRECYICKKIMGEKEPYENKSMTSGICNECFPLEMAKIEKVREKKTNETKRES